MIVLDSLDLKKSWEDREVSEFSYAARGFLYS